MDAVGGQIVLITGAANGIGAEVACQLHEKGARLVLADVDTEQLAKISSRLGDDRALAVVADVCDLSAMQATVDSGVERFGSVSSASWWPTPALPRTDRSGRLTRWRSRR